MSEARILPSPRVDSDVACVVNALHRSGPIDLGDLGDQPQLTNWGRQRLEHAVVSAWASDLISFDSRDLIVVL